MAIPLMTRFYKVWWVPGLERFENRQYQNSLILR